MTKQEINEKRIIENNKKIFISHSSKDSFVGEKLVDLLSDIGINKNDIFYSSLYHTGVETGKDFHDEIKKTLLNSELVILLLTPNFYNSIPCLNEMGACWILDKKIVPFLCNGLSYKNMDGFIDSRRIAFNSKSSKPEQLFYILNPYRSINIEKEECIEKIDKFIKDIESQEKIKSDNKNEINNLSYIEENILDNKFTDNELLLLNFIYDTQKFKCNDDNKELKLFIDNYNNFNVEIAKELLEESSIIEFTYNSQFQYVGFKMDLDTFRDLIACNQECQDKLNKIKIKYKKYKTVNTQNKNVNFFDEIICDTEFREIEGLLYCYIIDTYIFEFGDRWRADEQINSIRAWENNYELDNKLSNNYNTALNILKFRNILDIAEETAYGNPRLYKLKEEYKKMIIKINQTSKNILKEIKDKHYLPLPF